MRRVVPYEEALLFLLSIQKQPTAGMRCMPVKYIKSDWEEQHDGHDHSGKRDFAVKAKKLRRLGLVPGSVFGGPLREALALQLEEADARRLVEQKREGSKLKIVLDGQQIPVQIKEKAVNLLNNDILHLSFQALQADQKVNSVIHIFLTNTEKVTDALERMLMEIPYASLPEDMIDTITVDVEGMPCGTVLTVGDIPELNSGKLDLQADKTEIVLRISDKTRGPSRAAKQTEE